jgi:hypothetical protein
MLADDPDHDGFYGVAEYYFGLTDTDFNKKSGFDVFFQ